MGGIILALPLRILPRKMGIYAVGEKTVRHFLHMKKGAVAEAKTAAALFQMRNAPNNVQKGQAQICPQTDSSLAGQNGDKKVEISENRKIRPHFLDKKDGYPVYRCCKFFMVELFYNKTGHSATPRS